MCAIIGGMAFGTGSLPDAPVALMHETAKERGRDGSGLFLAWPNGSYGMQRVVMPEHIDTLNGASVWLQNMRAIPTTEMGRRLDLQQQPFSAGDWVVVHNGTIANDRELWAELGLNGVPVVDSQVLPYLLDAHGIDGLARVRGSYAIAAYNVASRRLVLAANYKPLYYSHDSQSIWFASEPEALPGIARKLDPYSVVEITRHRRFTTRALPGYVEASDRPLRALVIASGGLDSTVAAAWLVSGGYEVTLLHVQYEAQAQERELRAVTEVAEQLGVELLTMKQPLFVEAAQSPLTTAGASIAEGEAGAEFAHEWVPARNLVLAAMATAVAEARGIPFIALGNNLEESGAYPDNEPEFVRSLNQLMPNAVADGGYVRFIEPVGKLMKHEIAKLGAELGAPVAASWSCYRGGEVHCGECGPCFMRRRAHEYAGVTDPTVYAS